MAKSTNLNVTQNIKAPCVTVLPADTTVAKTLYTAGANDAVVKSLSVTSTDSAASNVKVIVNNTVADFVLGTVNVPITAGLTGAIPSVDLLASGLIPGLPLDQNGKRVLPLPAGYILKVAPLVTVTAAKQLDFVAVVEEY